MLPPIIELLSIKLSTCKPTTAKGFTIIELAVVLLLLVIITLAVGKVVVAGFDVQISNKVHATQQGVLGSVLDTLRADLRYARNIQVVAGGNSIIFDTYNPVAQNYQTVAYQYTGNTIRRTINGKLTDFLAGQNKTWEFRCGRSRGGVIAGPVDRPCFAIQRPDNDALQPVNQVVVNNLSIADVSVGYTAPLDNQFGKSSNIVPQAMFNVLSGYQFQ